MEGVEVPEAGDGPGVAQVHVLRLAEEAAQLGHGLAVVLLNRILLLTHMSDDKCQGPTPTQVTL